MSWSWYDRRTGRRATIATWPDEWRCGRDLGSHQFDVWVRGKRPDLFEIVEHLEVRPTDADGEAAWPHHP